MTKGIDGGRKKLFLSLMIIFCLCYQILYVQLNCVLVEIVILQAQFKKNLLPFCMKIEFYNDFHFYTSMSRVQCTHVYTYLYM